MIIHDYPCIVYGIVPKGENWHILQTRLHCQTMANVGSSFWSATTLSKNTFFSKKLRNAIKKKIFLLNKIVSPFFICSHFHSGSICFSSHSKNSCMYKNRGMISVCNKQCGDDDWPDKKSRHGYIWPWIDILENYFPAISSILYY